MGDAGIGLILGLGLDSSEAGAGIDRLRESFTGMEQNSKVSLDRIVEDSQPFERSLLNQHQAVHLLAEEMGIHLPRAVVSGISEMLPAIGGFGGALLAAFAIEEIPKLIHGIHDAADEMAGFGKEAKKAFEDAVRASDEAITHFKTIKEGIKLEDEVNRNIAALTVQRDVLDSTGGAAANYAEAVYQFMSGNVAVAAAHVALARAEKLDIGELQKLEAQRLEQLNTRTGLERDAARERKEAEREALEWADRFAKEAAEKQKRRAEEIVRFEHGRLEEKFRGEREWDRIVKEDAKAQAEAFKAVQKSMRDFPAVPANLFAALIESTKQLTAAERMALATENEIAKVRAELQKINPDLTRAEAQATAQRLAANPAIQAEIRGLTTLKHAHKDLEDEIRRELQLYPQYLGFMDSFNDAARQQAAAVGADMAGSLKSVSEGVAGLIAGRRAEAAVECIFEGAEGAKQLAMALDPYDPNHVQHALSAAEHFVSAVEYGRIAGTSSHHHGGGAGGGGGSSYGGSRDGGGGRDRSNAWPPATLAPGAGGAGGRFSSPGSGIIVVHGSTDLHQFVAGLVNGAVERGITVTSTQSQRGAPVGH